MAHLDKVKKGAGFFFEERGRSLGREAPFIKKLPILSLRKTTPFCYRYRLEDPALMKSVEKFGVLTPLVVSDAKRPVVIAGYKRLHVAFALKMKVVPVFVVKTMSPPEAFWANLISNWKQTCSEMDRAKALGMAARQFCFKENDIREIVMPLLGLPDDAATLELYRKLDQLEKPLQDLLEIGLLPVRGVTSFLKFAKKDQDYFSRMICARTRLTSSQFLQVGEWLVDLMRGTGKDLRAICRSEKLLEELDARGMDPRTKADKFFARVKRCRFPGYTRYLDAFEERRKKILRDPKEFRLEPIQGFEEPGFELHARVKTSQDLDRLLQKISEKRIALNSLFEIVL